MMQSAATRLAGVGVRFGLAHLSMAAETARANGHALAVSFWKGAAGFE